MAFHGKLRHTGYAAAAVTILTCLYSSIAYASEDVAETSRESTDDIYVTANVDKEMLKEEPESKTIISRAELDRKGARTLSDALAAEQDRWSQQVLRRDGRGKPPWSR